MSDASIPQALGQRGVSRREFLKFCAAMAATLGLSASYVPRIAAALEKKAKPSVIWLEFSDCAGDTESTLRATRPTIDQLVLDVISLDYHETIMAPSGRMAEKSKVDAMEKNKGKYIAVIEGAIPMKDGGVYCTIAGKTAVSIAREVCKNAALTLAVGSCAVWGGIAEAAPNPTGCVGVRKAVPNVPLLNIPGCPVNVENVTATIVHFLTFGTLPATDGELRPLFGYGIRIHDNCERRKYFDAGQFVRKWGDEGARLGWCLYEMGCKGPEAYYNCPTIRWNDHTSWPVMAGHPCFACARDYNWDALGPIYARLPNVPGAGAQTTANEIGIGVAAAAGAAVIAHAVTRAVKSRISAKPEETPEKKR